VEFHCHDTWGWLDTVQEGLVIMLTLMLMIWITFHHMCLELMMKQIGIKCCLYRVVLIVPYLRVDGWTFHFQAHMQNRKKQLLDSMFLSIYLFTWNTLVPTGQIIMEIDNRGFFRESEICGIQVILKSDNYGYYT